MRQREEVQEVLSFVTRAIILYRGPCSTWSTRRPVAGALSGVHEGQHVDCRADRIADEHEDHQVREAADRVGAADVVRVTKNGEAQRSLEHIAHAPTHFGDERLPETGDGGLVTIRRVVELFLCFGLDVEPDHRARSLASMRSKTSSAGRPFDSPARTRAARRATSSLHARESSSTDSLGAMASTTTRRSSSESWAASSITSCTVAMTQTCSLGAPMSSAAGRQRAGFVHFRATRRLRL